MVDSIFVQTVLSWDLTKKLYGVLIEYSTPMNRDKNSKALSFSIVFFDGSTRLFSKIEGITSIFFIYACNLMALSAFFSYFLSGLILEITLSRYFSINIQLWKCARSVTIEIKTLLSKQIEKETYLNQKRLSTVK